MDEKKIIDNTPDLNQREHIKYINTIQTWNPTEYFDKTLKQWNGFTCIISGSRMSGKSMFLKNLLVGEPKLANKFDFIIIFSKTLVNGFYSSFLDTSLMFTQFQEGVIDSFKKLHQQAIEKGKKFKWLCILDDMVDNKTKYKESLLDLFTCGRHYGASIFILTQKLSLLATGYIGNNMIFVNMFASSRQEKEYIANKIVTDAIDHDFSHLKLSQVERTAYLIQTEICQDYNALIITPYEQTKIWRYKAPLVKYTKRKKNDNSIKLISN